VLVMRVEAKTQERLNEILHIMEVWLAGEGLRTGAAAHG
jgi:hypothetical protein